jgi:Protein of unknown function (DUF2971)
MSNLNATRDDELPELLWHYTSAQGLQGILEDQAIWLSDCELLNDSGELEEGFAVAAKLLEALREKPSEDPQVGEFVKILARMAQGHALPDRTVYVSSLSATKDSLSQWRGYCPVSGGYAIGFDGRSLQTIAERHRVELMKCLYHGDEQETAIRGALAKVLDPFHEAGSTSHLVRIAKDAVRDYGFRLGLLTAASRIKNSGFEEEREWRLAHTSHVTDRTIKFRPMRPPGGPLIPYLIFCWKHEPNPIREIKIGPMQHQALAEKRLNMFLRTLGSRQQETTISRSETPYRA